MKRILLTTALVGFAGAAAAEVSFGGDAEIGYNDDFNNGMFWSMGLTVTGSMELDNGLTASISGDVEFNGVNSTYNGNNITIDDLVVSLSSDTASLTFGDTAPAADALWSSPVTNLDADAFNDEGDHIAAGEEGVLIGRATFGATEVALSYYVGDTNGGSASNDLLGLQIGATTTIGNTNVVFGYQDGEIAGSTGDIFALGASTTFGGLDVGVAYAEQDGGVTSMGVQAAYTFGQVTGTVFYVAQDGADDNYGVAVDYANGPITVGALYHDGADEDMQLNVSYDVGNGLNLFAGYRDEGSAANDTYFYVGGDYDLGGGASLRVSYADADAGVGTALDELGSSEDVKVGTTVAVSFDF